MLTEVRRRLGVLKVAAKVAAAGTDPYRPLLAQIVVTRRCNLSCGYCYEHDHHSPPVPFDMPRWDEVRLFRVAPVVISVLDYTQGFGHTDLVTC